MAWFRNVYVCPRCGGSWADHWSATCDDDCRQCGTRHISPDASEDLTECVVADGAEFVVLRSPATAGHAPDYTEVARFQSYKAANRSMAKNTNPAPE